MEIERTDDGFAIKDKVENGLDRFVWECLDIISPHTDYIIVSGYICISLGRSRATEDVDMIIDRIDRDTFHKIYDDAMKAGFYFLNPEEEEGLFEMLNESTSIRMAKEGTIIPNLEIKFPRDELGIEALLKKKILYVNEKKINISPIEMQIAYKIYLGSAKDIEDARYLWELMKEYLDRDELKMFMGKLNVDGAEHDIG